MMVARREARAHAELRRELAAARVILEKNEDYFAVLRAQLTNEAPRDTRAAATRESSACPLCSLCSAPLCSPRLRLLCSPLASRSPPPSARRRPRSRCRSTCGARAACGTTRCGAPPRLEPLSSSSAPLLRVSLLRTFFVPLRHSSCVTHPPSLPAPHLALVATPGAPGDTIPLTGRSPPRTGASSRTHAATWCAPGGTCARS